MWLRPCRASVLQNPCGGGGTSQPACVAATVPDSSQVPHPAPSTRQHLSLSACQHALKAHGLMPARATACASLAGPNPGPLSTHADSSHAASTSAAGPQPPQQLQPVEHVDFDELVVDDDYLMNELGFTLEELEEQREMAGAAFTDPEGVDMLFDELSSLSEDTPPELRAALLDRNVYGPEAVILAGFPPDELGIVRAVIDQAGGQIVKVLPASRDTLYNSVDEAIWSAEQDWSAPRPNLSMAMEGLGAWGAQRTLLFSGLSIKAQATVVELLEGVGLGPLAVSMILEQDGPKRLGDLLAETVQNDRKRRTRDKSMAAAPKAPRVPGPAPSSSQGTVQAQAQGQAQGQGQGQAPGQSQGQSEAEGQGQTQGQGPEPSAAALGDRAAARLQGGGSGLRPLPPGMTSRMVDKLPSLQDILKYKLQEQQQQEKERQQTQTQSQPETSKSADADIQTVDVEPSSAADGGPAPGSVQGGTVSMQDKSKHTDAKDTDVSLADEVLASLLGQATSPASASRPASRTTASTTTGTASLAEQPSSQPAPASTAATSQDTGRVATGEPSASDSAVQGTGKSDAEDGGAGKEGTSMDTANLGASKVGSLSEGSTAADTWPVFENPLDELLGDLAVSATNSQVSCSSSPEVQQAAQQPSLAATNTAAAAPPSPGSLTQVQQQQQQQQPSAQALPGLVQPQKQQPSAQASPGQIQQQQQQQQQLGEQGVLGQIQQALASGMSPEDLKRMIDAAYAAQAHSSPNAPATAAAQTIQGPDTATPGASNSTGQSNTVQSGSSHGGNEGTLAGAGTHAPVTDQATRSSTTTGSISSSSLGASGDRSTSAANVQAPKPSVQQRVKDLIARSRAAAKSRSAANPSSVPLQATTSPSAQLHPAQGASAASPASLPKAYGPELPPPPGSQSPKQDPNSLQGLINMRPETIKALTGKNVRFVDLSKLPSKYRQQMAQQAKQRAAGLAANQPPTAPVAPSQQVQGEKGEDAHKASRTTDTASPVSGAASATAAAAAAAATTAATTAAVAGAALRSQAVASMDGVLSKALLDSTDRSQVDAVDSTDGSQRDGGDSGVAGITSSAKTSTPPAPAKVVTGEKAGEGAGQGAGEGEGEGLKEVDVRVWQRRVMQNAQEEEEAEQERLQYKPRLSGRQGQLHRAARRAAAGAQTSSNADEQTPSNADDQDGNDAGNEEEEEEEEGLDGEGEGDEGRSWGGPRSRREISLQQLQQLRDAAQEQGLDPQQMLAEAMALGIIVKPAVAAAVGLQLPSQEVVAHVRSRIEAELQAEEAEEKARQERNRKAVQQRQNQRLGGFGRVTSGGRQRDWSVDIEEDGVISTDEFEEEIFEDGDGGYVRKNLDGTLDVEAVDLGQATGRKEHTSSAPAGSSSSSEFKGFGKPPKSGKKSESGSVGGWGAGLAARAARSRATASESASSSKHTGSSPQIEVVKVEDSGSTGSAQRGAVRAPFATYSRGRGVTAGRSMEGTPVMSKPHTDSPSSTGSTDGSSTASGKSSRTGVGNAGSGHSSEDSNLQSGRGSKRPSAAGQVQTMSRAQVEAAAARMGVSVDELLQDARSKGIQISDE